MTDFKGGELAAGATRAGAEEYPWSLRQPLLAASDFSQTPFEVSYQYRAHSLASTIAPNVRIISRMPTMLIEVMDVEPTANEIRGNVGLEIGERQDQIGLQGKDLIAVRRGESAHPWLFLTTSLWWPRDIAGDADDAVPARRGGRGSQVSSARQTIRLGGNIEALAPD